MVSPIVTVVLNLIVLSLMKNVIRGNQICTSDTPSVPKYHLIEKCYRSKLGVVAKANFTSLTSCQRLGIEKRGLALNFSPPGANKAGVDYTCEVLKCAEAEGGLSLANDTAFDYYSIYGKPLPDVNTTCVPAIGMFQLLPKRLNFTEARAACKNMSSALPDVSSEQRTDSLAQVLSGASVEAVFVAFRRSNSSVFKGENGDDTLECTAFRAWAPGHPKRNYTRYDCMLLTRRKTWLSVPCKKHIPVFCELNPGGPYKRRSIFAPKTKIENGNILEFRNNNK